MSLAVVVAAMVRILLAMSSGDAAARILAWAEAPMVRLLTLGGRVGLGRGLSYGSELTQRNYCKERPPAVVYGAATELEPTCYGETNCGVVGLQRRWTPHVMYKLLFQAQTFVSTDTLPMPSSSRAILAVPGQAAQLADSETNNSAPGKLLHG